MTPENKFLTSNTTTNNNIVYQTILLLITATLLLSSCDNEKRISINKKPQEFSILKSDTTTIAYNIKLTKDKFYSFTIEQKGIDVIAYLINGENKIIKQKDSPNGAYGPEQFYFYCEEDGEYKLQIKSLNDEPSEGKYSIAVSELSTNTEIDLEKKDYLEDFRVFHQIFAKANAGLYRYHSKKEVDSVFYINEAKIDDKTTYREFYNLIWDVIDYTGSLHNNLNLPKQLKTILYRKDVFFPIPLKYIDGKLYSNYNDNDIPVGAEIITVNGIGANEFADRISKYRSTDGFNSTEKYKYLETDWLPAYIYKAYGEKDQFKIEYKSNDTLNSTIVKSVSYLDFFDNYNERHSKAYEEKITNNYEYRYVDSLKVGILSIKSFNLGEKGHDSYKEYESFLDSVFISLKTKDNLIVDIRKNGGGSGDALMLLTSYLTNRTVRENLQAYSLFNKVPFPELYLGSIEDTEEFLSEYVSEFKDGKYYQNNKFNPYWQPNENSYKGKFILLIDPFVSSAASHFAAHIKSDQRAVIIGEETGGGYYGHTGHVPVNYELPNSKLILNFSIINLEQDVIKLVDEKNGDGVFPDYRIVQSHKDFLKNNDTQLNFAIDYIQKNQF